MSKSAARLAGHAIQQLEDCIWPRLCCRDQVCCLQDIVTAHEHFNMDEFVGQFQTALQVTSPKKRMFLLDWMGVSSLPAEPCCLL